MRTISIENINLGGLSVSEYQGTKNSVYRAIGIDLHSNPGLMQVMPKTQLQQPVIISGKFSSPIVKILRIDGDIFLFEQDGNVWEDGVNLENINSVSDVEKYKDYVYFVSEDGDDLGRKSWPGSSDWSDYDNTWQDISNDYTDGGVLLKYARELFIGSGNSIHLIDEDQNFTKDFFSIDDGYTIKDMIGYGSDILILARQEDGNCKIFKWNQTTTDYSSSDVLYDYSGNNGSSLCFIRTDNNVYVLDSLGKVYYYNGFQLRYVRDFPVRYENKDFRDTFRRIIAPKNAQFNFNGMAMIGFSVPNSTLDYSSGIMTFGQNISGEPNVFTHAFVPTYAAFDVSPDEVIEPSGNSFEVTAAAVVDDDEIWVAWDRGYNVNTSGRYGVDNIKIDASKYESALIETLIYTIDRRAEKTLNVEIHYRNLPEGTNVTITGIKNQDTEYVLATEHDDIRKTIKTTDSLDDASTFQLRFNFVTSSGEAVDIEKIDINFT